MLLRPARNLALSVAATVAALGLAEAWVRRFHPLEFRRPPARAWGDYWRDLVHRPSLVPGLDYELKPSILRRLTYPPEFTVRTNALGMRDDELVEPREPGTLRIAAVGDSMTFGLNVGNDEAWPNVLERILEGERQDADGPVEVLNLGVTAYSASDDAVVVRSRALALEPDLVIVGYYLNDPETDPVQLRQHFREPSLWEHSTLLRHLALQRRLADQRRLGGGNVLRYLHADEAKWAGVVAAFEDMARSSGRKSVPVLVAVLPTLYGFERFEDYPYRDIHRQVVEAAEQAGLFALDVLPAWEGCGIAPAGLRSDADHPDARGQALIAEAIAAWVRTWHRERLAGLPPRATGSSLRRR